MDQLLIGADDWWVDRWDRALMKIKKSQHEQTGNKHGFVTIIIFSEKKNVFNNGTSIHPLQKWGGFKLEMRFTK